MPTDYESLYAEQKDALGEPFREVCDVFENYHGAPLRVLDIGCGQGRDALFIARLGHRVTGVDLSPTGIAQMKAAAKTEGLNVTGIVADICEAAPEGLFDVVLIDRTLHMLNEIKRLAVLDRLLSSVAPPGRVLIVDEPRHIPDLLSVFDRHAADWSVTTKRRGFLFMQRS